MSRYEVKYLDAGPIIHTPLDDGELYGCEIIDKETDLVGTTHRNRSSKTKAYDDAWADLIEKQKEYYSTTSGNQYESRSESYQSNNTDKGIGTLIAWIIGGCLIILLIFAVIWFAFNVVLPIALLNSALALTIIALVVKTRKTLFAGLALIGGVYMLLDIINGWFSLNFIENVVKNPVWISAFVYINTAAIGLSVWLLIQPLWSKTEQMESTEKRKSLLLKGALILLVLITTIIAPIIFHVVKNPFVQKVSHNQSNLQSQSVEQKNEVENGTSKIQLEMIENQFIIDTYLGSIGDKEFKLVIEKVDGENVEGYNITGSNRRPVKGRIVNKWIEPTGLGGNYTIFKLILTEPGDDKWDGEFNIDLWISDQGRSGKGSWKSFNGKLERQILIKDPLNE